MRDVVMQDWHLYKMHLYSRRDKLCFVHKRAAIKRKNISYVIYWLLRLLVLIIIFPAFPQFRTIIARNSDYSIKFDHFGERMKERAEVES